MEIESIRHKALRQFVETGKPKGLNAQATNRLRKMVAFLVAIETTDELKTPPNWGAHELAGDRKGIWSLIVTKNWRLTFGINDASAIVDMDLEDYH